MAYFVVNSNAGNPPYHDDQVSLARFFHSHSRLFWRKAYFADEQRFRYSLVRIVIISVSVFTCNFVSVFSFDDDGKIFLYNKVERKIVPQLVLTWGWFSAREQEAQIHRLDGRMDTTQYLQLLTEMFNTRPMENFRFVHDHHPVHSARIVNQWFRDNVHIDVWPWPKNFGFVMPMETIWADILLKLEGTLVFFDRRVV